MLQLFFRHQLCRGELCDLLVPFLPALPLVTRFTYSHGERPPQIAPKRASLAADIFHFTGVPLLGIGMHVREELQALRQGLQPRIKVQASFIMRIRS